MKKQEFDDLLKTVEFKLTQKQRYLLFEHLYTSYSFDDMMKFEKLMLKQIKESVEMLNDETAKEVRKSCKFILKTYKLWKP